jgi:uncharacterized membrane protein YedE/YeeE
MNVNWIGGLLGGVMIGSAAVLLLAINGRIAGVSGIVGSLVTKLSGRERFWRFAFTVGLILGAGAYALVKGPLPIVMQAAGVPLIIAGFLVGFGTRLGSGCTSGHGVCGLARRSPRSLVATITFMVIAILTVIVKRQFGW